MNLVISENVSGSSKIFKLVSCAFIFTRNMHYIILDSMYKDAQDYMSCFVAAVRFGHILGVFLSLKFSIV